MRIRQTLRGCVLASVLLLGWGCGPAPNESAHKDGDVLRVFVSIPPVASLVERTGGDRVRVETLLAPGQGPHTFSPTPKQIMALGEASAYFHVGGFAFEQELAERIGTNFPSLAVQDVSTGISRTTETAHEHGDDTAGLRHAEELDPHVWMSPPLLKVMASTVAETLKRLDPEHSEQYERNLENTLSELDTLDKELRQQLGPFKGRTFYVYHPALGYFAEAYGLHQESVEVGGKKPTPRQLQQLIEHAKADNVNVVFVQPQFDQRSAESVAEAIGGSVVSLDPLREDVFDNLREIGTSLAESFGTEQSP